MRFSKPSDHTPLCLAQLGWRGFFPVYGNVHHIPHVPMMAHTQCTPYFLTLPLHVIGLGRGPAPRWRHRLSRALVWSALHRHCYACRWVCWWMPTLAQGFRCVQGQSTTSIWMCVVCIHLHIELCFELCIVFSVCGGKCARMMTQLASLALWQCDESLWNFWHRSLCCTLGCWVATSCLQSFSFGNFFSTPGKTNIRLAFIMRCRWWNAIAPVLPIQMYKAGSQTS